MADGLPNGAAFSGRTAVVTGGSRGIGGETAKRLARDGAHVILVARPSNDLRSLAERLGSSASVIEADLSDSGVVAETVDRVTSAIGVPDILINNAGAFHVAPFHELDLADFERSVAVNLIAPFILVRAFLEGMRTRASGHIVTIGSISDRQIFPDNAAYASTKFGLRAMHEVLRAETRGSGVRATLVSPGPVDTRLWDPIDPDNREGFTPRDEMLDPQAVADAVMYALLRPPHVDIDELRLSRS